MIIIGEIMTDFVKWLENELNERRWKRADLARAAKLSQTSFSKIFSGERKPGPDLCNAIARALGIPEETVFRKAGLLPATPEEDSAFIGQIVEVLNRMSVEQRQAVLRYSLFEYQREPQGQGELDTEDTGDNQDFSKTGDEEEGHRDSGLVLG